MTRPKPHEAAVVVRKPTCRRQNLRRSVARLVCVSSIAVCMAGCTAAVKQAAESAAPAAVEEAVEEAKEPSTRDAVAEILDDPDIRASTAQLSESVTQGLVRGVEKEVPIAELERLTDAVVARVGLSVAQSLERDVAPRLSAVATRVVEDTLNQALDQQTEERLQAVVASVTRATMSGVNEALVHMTTANGSDPLSSPSAQLTKNAWYSLGYNGAHGFEQAVRDAHLRQQDEEAPSVLGLLGTVASLNRTLPLVLLGLAIVLVLALTGALVWVLVLLRRQRFLMRDRSLIESQLSRAIQSGQDADWFDELARQVARAAQHKAAASAKSGGE